MAKYTFSQLETLWKKAGGSAVYAAMAAAVAMAESGGNSTAINKNKNGSVDRGLWQINSVHGSQSTTDPLANARAAVSISKNGTDWRPWCSAYSNNNCTGTFLGPGSHVLKYLPAGSPTGKIATGTGIGAAAANAVGQVTAAMKAISAAKTELGKPYKFGAEEAGVAFDCSGLTQWAYKQAGINIPRTAAAQQSATTPVSKANAKPGDLVFYGNPAHHVALYLGNGLMIEAPHTGAVIKVTNVGSPSGYGRVNGSGAGATTATPALFGIPNPLSPGDIASQLAPLEQTLDPANWWTNLIQPALMKVFYIGEVAIGLGVMVFGVMLLLRTTDTYKRGEAVATAAATKGAVSTPPPAPKEKLPAQQQAQLNTAKAEGDTYGRHSKEGQKARLESGNYGEGRRRAVR